MSTTSHVHPAPNAEADPQPAPTPTPPESVLFSHEPVVDPARRKPPLIVVGLPRSGSTFLTHVLSSLRDWYVFDDLYFYQNVYKHGWHKGVLDEPARHKLLNFLGWQLRARIRHESIYRRPDCAWDDVARVEQAVARALRERPVRWHELMEEWLTRLALHHGRGRWGYKTPQDFLHMNMLAELFPGVRFLFVVRDPRAMMASKKFVRSQDGDPRQYHPWAYAWYWNMAWKTVRRFRDGGRAPVHTVHFEQLISAPETTAAAIAAFLETELDALELPRASNSSFADGRRRAVNPTEQWLCQAIAGSSMRQAGYEADPGRPRLRDLPELAWISARFASHQAARAFGPARKRVTFLPFLRTLWHGHA